MVTVVLAAALASSALVSAARRVEVAPARPEVPPPSGSNADPGAGFVFGRSSSSSLPALPPAAPMPAHVRWIAIGGGPDPELNQISLEEDLLLAREVLGEEGVILFAGGPGTRAVQVEDDLARGDPLRIALGDLLASRGDRGARYQPTRLAVHGAATLVSARSVLAAALADGDDPLLLWIAAHGERGEVPTDATVLLWAGDELRPSDLYEIVRDSGTRRPLRLVITSCFAGGFAELAFRDLDPERGPTDLEVCGLFATSWEEEASGCDPSPDRASHEGYGIHLLEAVRGRDRHGRDVRSEIDLDGDGRIDWLEAHAHARIAALSLDVPTSTSSRLLRVLAPAEGPSLPVELPDEQAVVAALGARLRIAGPQDARARLAAIARRRAELESAYDKRREESDALWWQLVGALLSRWPVIDDPWHPDFEPTLARERDAIQAFLEHSNEYAEWLEAREDLEAMEATLAALRVEAAPIRRWLEAWETIVLAGRLRARGGEAWERWQRMRACEGGGL